MDPEKRVTQHDEDRAPRSVKPIVLQVGVILLLLALLGAAWKWTDLREWANPDRLADTLAPYRSHWLGAALMLAVFVVAELVMFPVLVLILVCGIAFGPWLGSIYAFVGTLASTLLPFFIGRKLGRKRLERYGGAAVRGLEKVLTRRGVLAVFLVRKLPAPFTLVNMVCGASPISLRDFMLGTTLGMGAIIVLLAVLGDRMLEIAKDPTPRQILFSLLLLLVPVIPAVLVQRALNRRAEVRR